jgi:hypothetical protein
MTAASNTFGRSIAIRADALDFSGIIRAGDVVVCGQATSEPRTLTKALIAQADKLPPFKMVVGPLFSDTFAAPERTAGIELLSYGAIGNARALVKAGCLDVITSNYSTALITVARSWFEHVAF